MISRQRIMNWAGRMRLMSDPDGFSGPRQLFCLKPVAEGAQSGSEGFLASLLPALATLLGDGGYQAPVGVHRLEIVAVGAAQVVHQATQHAVCGRDCGRQTQGAP